MRASLSGVRPEDVRIEAHGNRVTISGQMRKEQETERENSLRRERRIGQFYRTLTLPTEVNSDAAEATFASGILTVRLPKSEAARSRQIAVRAESMRAAARPGTGAESKAGPASNARARPGAVSDARAAPGPASALNRAQPEREAGGAQCTVSRSGSLVETESGVAGASGMICAPG